MNGYTGAFSGVHTNCYFDYRSLILVMFLGSVRENWLTDPEWEYPHNFLAL